MASKYDRILNTCKEIVRDAWLLNKGWSRNEIEQRWHFYPGNPVFYHDNRHLTHDELITKLYDTLPPGEALKAQVNLMEYIASCTD